MSEKSREKGRKVDTEKWNANGSFHVLGPCDVISTFQRSNQSERSLVYTCPYVFYTLPVGNIPLFCLKHP